MNSMECFELLIKVLLLTTNLMGVGLGFKWDVKFQRNFFARNSMKCSHLPSKDMFPTATQMGWGGGWGAD